MPIPQGLKELRESYSSGLSSGRTGAHVVGALVRNAKHLVSSDDESGPKDEGRKPQHDDSAESSNGTSGAPVKSSHIIEEHIDVGVDQQTAFKQWTNYPELSKMTKAESAESKREGKVSFTSKIGPSTRSWQTEIVEQVPPRRIAWRSVGGAKTMGVVTFHKIDERLTRLMVEMEYHPSGAFETVGNFLRMQRRRVRKDLRLFKNHIELTGEANGNGGGRIKGGGLRDEMDERSSSNSPDEKSSSATDSDEKDD